MRSGSLLADANLLELIPEHSPDLLALLDANGLFLYGNAAHFLRLGRNPESLIGATLFDLIHRDDIPLFEKAILCRPAKRTPFRLSARWLKDQGKAARFDSIGKWISADQGRSQYLLLCSREALPEKDKAIPATDIAELRTDAIKLLARAEGEKTQVARAIHDDLGQKLTALSLELSLWKTELDNGQSKSVNAIREKLAVLGDLANGMIGSTRNITATLRPRVLEEFGLAAALEWHLEKVQKQTGMTCAFTSECQKLKVDLFNAAQIFHVAEEIISSRAQVRCKHLKVRLLTQDGAVALVFEDAGKERGLAPETCARVRLLGGEIEENNGDQMIVVAFPLRTG
jgi:PAS domain S-box-containing protein